jgi:hypothetical protein
MAAPLPEGGKRMTAKWSEPRRIRYHNWLSSWTKPDPDPSWTDAQTVEFGDETEPELAPFRGRTRLPTAQELDENPTGTVTFSLENETGFDPETSGK